MTYIVEETTEDCGCNRCGTYAKVTSWSYHCLEVDIYDDRNPCDECTDFSGMRERCGQSGEPEDHDD